MSLSQIALSQEINTIRPDTICMPRADFNNLMTDVRIIIETDSIQKMQIGNLRRDLGLANNQISVISDQLEVTEDKLNFTERELRKAKAWYNNKFMWFGIGVLATVYLTK